MAITLGARPRRNTRWWGGAAWRLGSGAIGWLLARSQARAAIGQLGRLNDHELHDIGLVRQDLWDMQALRPGLDPTRELACRVAQRRRNRR